MEGELDLLGESFTLSLQQIMTSLSSLELRLHQPQRLTGWEDSFSILGGVSVDSIVAWSSLSYPSS